MNYDDGKIVDDEEQRIEILAWASIVENMLTLRHLRGLICMVRWVGTISDGRLILETRRRRLNIDVGYFDDLYQSARNITSINNAGDHDDAFVGEYIHYVLGALFGYNDKP